MFNSFLFSAFKMKEPGFICSRDSALFYSTKKNQRTLTKNVNQMKLHV